MQKKIDILNSREELILGGVPPEPPIPAQESEITKSWNIIYEKPLVSILCHCYNHETLIEQALNGFLMQRTNFPWEIIIHDDASTDNSATIIKKYAEKYPKIIKPILQSTNQYSIGNKPSLFTATKAEGDFLAFCEGDDYWLDPKKLQIQADFLKNNPKYSVCGHDAFIFKDNKIIALSKLPEKQKKDANPKKVKKGIFILTLTAMFRNELKVYEPESHYIVNGDNFIFSRLGELGSYKYINIIYPGAYRVHDGGVWSSKDNRDKAPTRINSIYWISQYYKRVGDKEMCVHYSQSACLLILENSNSMSFKQLMVMMYMLCKQALRKNNSKIYRIAKKLFSIV